MRAIRVALVVGGLGGCYNPTPPTGAPCDESSGCPTGQTCIAGFCGGSDGGAIDAEVTVDVILVDAPALCTTWTARHFDPCALPAPGGDLVLTDALSTFSWDTSSGVLKGKMNTLIPVTTTVMTQSNGADVLVASVGNFTLEAGANLDIIGSRPLLIAVWGSASIAGDIDVSASFSSAGPGGSSATSTLCPSAPTGDAGASGAPAKGGGGGAFQGGGGRGGNAGGLGGTALGAPPDVIRGGCAAGSGGASAGGIVGTRGGGGGAIQISARIAIDVTSTGTIDAGGGAGSYGRAPYGGSGGGGAGGYIGLDSPMITVAGVLAANGGSGGGGASDVANGSSGSDGLDSDSAATGGPGAPTSNIGTCARGGNGSAGTTLTGENAPSSACGGGGGGGAAGYILSWSSTPTVTGTVSPPFVAGPN